MKSSTGKFWRVAWVAGLICAGNAGHAAEVSDLRRDPDALARSAAAGGADVPALLSALGLGGGDGLEVIRVAPGDAVGSVTRYRQSFRNIPLWGQQLVVERDAAGRVRALNGNVVRGLAADVPRVQPGLDATAVLEAMKTRLLQGFGNVAPVVSRGEIELVVFTGREEVPSSQARLAYAVSFLADAPGGGRPTRPTFLVDAFSGQVLFEVD